MKDILFIIGSDSDRDAVQPGIALIEEKSLTYTLEVISAHRNLPQLIQLPKRIHRRHRIQIKPQQFFPDFPRVLVRIENLQAATPRDQHERMESVTLPQSLQYLDA